MRIFLSHASEDRNIAERIYLVLSKVGHRVFFDRAGLHGGDDYNNEIQKNIRTCELLIFLISPDSVRKTSYALTELRLAEDKWRYPHDHVLPVMVRQTDHALIPEYLKAVTILEPVGNTAVEVQKQVVGWKKRHGHNTKRRLMIVLSALLVSSVITTLIWYNSKQSQANDLNNSAPSASPTANNVSPPATPSVTPSTSHNTGRVQPQPPNQPTPDEKSNQVTPVTFRLTSRVLDGEHPIKGARISIVGSPGQGVLQSNQYGLFTLEIADKQLRDTVTVRVEYDGFVTWQRDITLGVETLPPMLYMERKK